ncbi:acetaldehyde dehydrogenase (acetylating) [Brevibacillus borstelensis]|uniref:acetaldehyde dehydrogenase (acetylating) n=1 Tax=Brevibacillus borstelensis TaxID=45462 RepID=UPI0004687166|nr:acetaldehyde dehydrogenase (acetylating) [Brevibacillus borstelensis]MCC0564011.1 acetaldehyde dehydrogenase (acetylating) [Brevibacillus borstelensis]MCM3558152.1 acetaldehyde dehydrogenase (acetylating) [Brevibacillus borstelensis]MCM3621155.1 acetaldehyde dehydrogenase (acetylating) [Brevibacillus borstelensis]MED1853630.1 acetaldehyde dehydrogenase (acetylating) [Brevibacillus borstelensis]MED1873364.1 acetaldehyde dehydrogenase (acetylating) [Brevibacillus borstelensis]
MSRKKVAILGSGNIGTDLLMKLERSKYLEVTAMIGIDPDSDGLLRAKKAGYEVFDGGLKQFLDNAPELAEIVFDATSAKAHIRHAKALKEAGKLAIDLTPAAVGPYVVPSVNLGEHLHECNINLITCGGQATIPIVHAIHRVCPVSYAEIVAAISSKSAGPGTRANIDEFTETTARGLEVIGGAKQGKAIIILNPAEPPIMMRDTVYALVEGEVDEQAITASIEQTVAFIQSYVPGYRLRTEPLFDGNRVTVVLELEGAGDYLPKYAGNLDIMTATAVKVAEEFAKPHVGAASV